MNKISIATAVASGGVAQNFELGFTPAWVKIVNATDLTKIEYNSDDTVNTAGIAYTASGTASSATAGSGTGISAYTGTAQVGETPPVGKGITVAGTAAVMDTTGDVLIIEAGFYDE